MSCSRTGTKSEQHLQHYGAAVCNPILLCRPTTIQVSDDGALHACCFWTNGFLFSVSAAQVQECSLHHDIMSKLCVSGSATLYRNNFLQWTLAGMTLAEILMPWKVRQRPRCSPSEPSGHSFKQKLHILPFIQSSFHEPIHPFFSLPVAPRHATFLCKCHCRIWEVLHVTYKFHAKWTQRSYG